MTPPPPDARARPALDPPTLARLRAVWWRLWRLGVRLPAELGIIIVPGGGR